MPSVQSTYKLLTVHSYGQVPVRPFRHDEYERFIVSAYPYYASAASLMVAFLMLDFVLLYRK